MGPKGELEEFEGNESSEKGGVSGNDWREKLEQVDTKYLGVIISDDGSMQREVKTRIGCASRVVGGMDQAILRR